MLTTPYSNSGSTFLGCSKNVNPSSDIIFMGVPTDNGVTNRPGTRFGPEAIRRSSMMMFGERDHQTRVNPCLDLHLADIGDVSFDDLEQSIQSNLHKYPQHQPITFGGDHSITYPIIRALKSYYNKPIDIIHFDAHLDTWKGNVTNHSSPFFCSVNDNLVGKVTQLGIRGPSTTQAYDFAVKNGFDIFTAEKIHTSNLLCYVNGIYDKINNRGWGQQKNPTYLTIDIDALDPSQAPGTGTPEIGGLFTWQILTMINMLFKTHNFIGMDVVEVSPPYDVSEITSLAAATFVWRYICNVSSYK